MTQPASRAPCQDHLRLVDAAADHGPGSRASQEMKHLCGGCTIRRSCLRWAMTFEQGKNLNHRYGVWGGYDAAERLVLASAPVFHRYGARNRENTPATTSRAKTSTPDGWRQPPPTKERTNTTPMTRSTATARAAGARFERTIADYLCVHVSEFIDRRVTTGPTDKGDLTGVRAFGKKITCELKDHGGQVRPGPWLREVDTERGNDDAVAGVVVAKRRGTTDPGDQVVLMTVRDLVALLTGTRP